MKGSGIQMKKNLEEMQVKVANKRAILESHDGEEFSPITVAKNVLCEDGTTMQDYFDNHSEPNISTKIVNSNSMSKVGQGDNVDFSDNVMNGAYESCKMYGKSLVNLFNSKQITPSLNFSSNNDGKYENIVKSNGLIEFDIVGSKNPGNYQYINMGKVNVDLLKPNTRYLVLFEEITGIDTVSIRDGNSANTVIDYTKVGGKQYVILTTLSEWQKSNQILYLYVQSKTGIHVKVKNAMIIEYQEGMEQWDLDYFEGLCDVKSPILMNIGKNLLPDSVVWTPNRSMNDAGNTSSSDKPYSHTTEDYLPIEWIKVSSSQCRISYETDNLGWTNVVQYDDKKAKITKTGSNNSTGFKFTVQPNAKYFRLSVSTYKLDTVMIEEGLTATSYESYKSNTTTFTSNDDEIIVLRSLPNGICDTLNVRTGEYVQRVGEIVFDGSNDENWFENNNFPHNGQIVYGTRVTNLNGRVPYPDGISDTLPFIRQGYESNKPSVSTYMKDIYVRINGSTKEDLKAYLSQNPITVQYELSEPIVTTIEPSTTPFAYENGHIILESGYEGQSLLPTLEYQTVVSRSGQVAMIDKTIQQHERKITLLEKMLVQNIIDIEYKNTLLALKLEIDEVI